MASWTHKSTGSQYNTNNSNSASELDNNNTSTTSTINLTNYELAYHHHLQTALQMGQFYNPEHLSAGHHHHQHHHSHHATAASLLRNSTAASSASSSSLNQSTSLMNGVGSSGNCIGGIGANSLWDNPLISSSQRNSTIPSYHNNNNHEIVAATPGLPCDIWAGSAVATVPTVNGRNSGRNGQHKQSNKKPRRRVATMAQRRAANIRERRRMFNLNEAFDKLRRKVPTFAYEKRLSRIETLRLAITYISFMADILAVPNDTRGSGGGGGGGGKTSSEGRKNANSVSNNHNNILQNNSQYSLLARGGNLNNNGVPLIGGIDCHQNQNVPPSISSFTPLVGRWNSHHTSPTTYLHSNIHHH